MQAVSIAGLQKTFKTPQGPVHALADINLEIRKGEIFGLLGPNGAGKTTLISILAGTTTADAGKVLIFGKDISTDLREIQQSINMVRGFSGVLNKCSVLQLMRYYAMVYSVPKPEERIESILRMIGLWDRKHQFVSTLSSGWRQRFFIAKALLNSPKLLLLDEPTVGLDVDMAITMRALVRRLRDDGHTILLTTHYMQEADELCDRIALIADGRIAASGTSAQLKAMVRKEETVEIGGTVHAQCRARLERLPGVLGVSHSGTLTRVLLKSGDSVTGIMKVLVDEGVRATAVRLVEPTLEDVFLKLTKRGFEGGGPDE